MKKLLMLGLFGAMAMSAVAQGTMQFQNSAFSPIRIIRSGGTLTNNATAADGVVVAMFWGTTAGSVTNLGGAVGISASAGVIAGNTVFPVAGTQPGDSNFFTVAAWDASYGSTLQGMLNCIAAGGLWGSAGSSSYGVVGPALGFGLGATSGPGTVMFGSAATVGVFHTFNMNLNAVPEPSTLALGGLGIASLLMFRRKK